MGAVESVDAVGRHDEQVRVGGVGRNGADRRDDLEGGGSLVGEDARAHRVACEDRGALLGWLEDGDVVAAEGDCQGHAALKCALLAEARARPIHTAGACEARREPAARSRVARPHARSTVARTLV